MRFNQVLGVAFDLDGTLLDSVDAHVESWIKAFQEHGLEEISRDEMYRLIGLPGEVIVKKIGGVKALKKYQSIRKTKDSLFMKMVDRGDVTIYPDVEDTLMKLKDKRYRLGLSTSTPNYMLKNILMIFKIKKYFDALVAGDEVERGKPYPDIFLKVFEKLDVKPEQGVIVGDSEYDLIPAREIRATFVLVNYRERNLYLSWKERPNIIVNKVSDLLKIL